MLSIKKISIFGLIFITFLGSIQYIFLSAVPESVSSFAFMFITNLVGFVILGISSIKVIKFIKRRTYLKGFLLALELTGFNFFMILGSKNMDSVIISSVVSIYFIFVTPLLLIFKKSINFFSSIASVIAVLALLLMFGTDTSILLKSTNIIYLLLADVFFALYVVSISIWGENENPTQLTLTQILSSLLVATIGFGVELFAGKATFSLPTDFKFWITVAFIGIFIRAVYGILQMKCQKHTSALTASLIFSTEIIMTMIMNPILSRIMGTEYAPATIFQVIGAVLLIISILLVDEETMKKLGYKDINVKTIVDKDGNVIKKSSVSRKMIFLTMTLSMVIQILSVVISLSAIGHIRIVTIENSTKLGEETANISSEALKTELETELINTANEKGALAQTKLLEYASQVNFAASYARTLYSNPNSYPKKEVMYPLKKNGGKWTMQRVLADESIKYDSIKNECSLFGGMEDVFKPIIKSNSNISTIYMGTEDGILLSYDIYSDTASEKEEELYYEYRKASWYTLAKDLHKNGKTFAFTETYQDSYGRGLTITCLAPISDKNGNFIGCVAADILMKDLNRTIVSEGIKEPSFATLIDNKGNIIAHKDIDPNSEKTFNIKENNNQNKLYEASEVILRKKTGITKIGIGDNAYYIAYAEIPSTNWILCMASPLNEVVKPAIAIHEKISKNTSTIIGSVVNVTFLVIQVCIVISALIFLVISLLVGKFTKKIIDPLKKLEQDVNRISQGNLSLRTLVKTDDEIGNLALSFNDMAESLQKYITDLKEATAKEERIASELNVATKIQVSSLPSEYPNCDEYEIFATMNPAKEVGGDFYDFFKIDDTHLGLVIADVSGKGVPAALFMMISKTLVETQCKLNTTLSPGQILTTVNNQLCEHNSEDMFVSVWLGIFDITTGSLTASNAGHEFPAIKRANGNFEIFEDKHGFVLGGMPEMKYKEYKLELQKGDRLFVYTDGVAEANNINNELYGTDRMVTALNKYKDNNLQDLLKNMRVDIDEFVKEAPQFDDITMLCMEYRGYNA